MISAEQLNTYETCPRRYKWTDRYELLRISPVKALYVALDAGLRTESDPEQTAESTFLGLAGKPGLDVAGGNVYAMAMHYAKLAGILTVALRSAYTAPWRPVDPVILPDGSEWRSGLYNAGAAHPLRLALVDRWTDDRKLVEIGSWRTLGETCALNVTILVTAITIGPSQGQRRHSPWTRCYRHPRNRTFRLQRKGSEEDFGKAWARVWREDSSIPTALWLDKMREDGCMEDLVHTVQVPPPRLRNAYLAEMMRMSKEISELPDVPQMRLSGCYGFSQCPFVGVCPSTRPELFGFRYRSAHIVASLEQHDVQCCP